MVLKRLSQPTAQPTTDPLALLSNVSNTQHGSPSSSTSSITPLPPPRANSTDDLIENLTSALALLTQSYRTFLPQTNNQLRTSSNPRNQATGGNAAGYEEAQNKVRDANQGQARPGQARTVKCYNCNGGPDNAFDDDVDEQPVQDLALNMDNVFQAEDCDAFDSDVNKAPTAQTIFMANLSSADPISDEVRPSYDSNILSEVQDHDQYLDDTCAYQEEHVMHDSVQLDHVVDLHADYTSVGNMISYDHYVKDNEVLVVHSNASSVQNDTFRMIYNDMCEPSAPSVSNSSRNAVVKNSLTAKLATYREQVELYERRANFELTEREQKINEQLRLVISDRNFKEETLKRELHSTKLQLASTINRNKSMVKDKLVKQDQSLQTIHMLCRPRPLYNDQNKVVIGYKNPLCLTRAKQAQPALYNGHEILKDNHARAKYQNLKDGIGNHPPTPDKDTPDFDFVFVIGKMQASLQGKDNAICQLKKQLSKLQVTSSDTERTVKVRITDSQLTKVTDPVTNLQAQNDLFRAENDKVKQHYKQLYDSIKITRTKHIEQVTKLTAKNVTLKNNFRVKPCPKASGSQPKSNPKTNRILLAKGTNKLPVEDLPRMNKSHRKTTNRVDSSSRIKRTVINSNSDSICQTCKKCLTSFDHDMCVAVYVRSVVIPHSTRHNCNVERKIKQVWKPKHVEMKMKQVWKPKQVGKVWKPIGKVLTTIGHQWRPTGQILHLGTQCLLTRFTPPQVVVLIVLWYLDSGCSKHMTGDRSRLLNFIKKFIGTVRFGNDHFGAIMGYGDYVVGESVISRVYYVEGLGHNLFSVRQFCDSDLEVAFRKHTCYVRDTDGVDLIKGSHGSNLYTISVKDMMKSSPICLLSKASKNKSWLWYQRLNHLNFGTINDLARKVLVRGLPRLKFEKDHLCSACQLGKSKKHTHKPKAENTNLEVLNTLHMDLCGPMRVQTINGKKYILVIVDDYSRFTWVKFLRSKDETLNTVPRTPQQNGVVERQNCTLIEDARTMLIFSKALMFLWAEVVATACYTQNRSLIHTRHHKTPYELVHNKKPDLTFFRVFGALCYLTNNSEDLGKLQPTADTRIFVGYAPSRKGYRIYNKRT
nr:retrovirus-related Pol polyprotein from transposon TNT 1-94 [Tanacetum cinerariifolium]